MKRAIYVVGILVLFACQSAPSDSEVLVPIEEPVTAEVEKPSDQPAAAAPHPLFDELRGRLTALGYEGVGLEYESEHTLRLLNTVFAHPDAAQRQVRLLYTGGELLYDATHESLTVGGVKDAQTILQFIRQNVPLRKPVEKTE